MPDSSAPAAGAPAAPVVDVSTITDPHTRRAVRGLVQLNQQLTEQLRQHQLEIEALLHMMVEKHVGSVGEFKRHMLKLQQNDARSERIHGQISGHAAHAPAAAHPAPPAAVTKPAAAAPPVAAAAPVAPKRTDYGAPEIDRPRRYTL